MRAHLSNKICLSIAPSVNNIKTISCLFWVFFFFLPTLFSARRFEVKVIFKEEKSAPGILLIVLLGAAMIRLEVRVYLPFFIPNHNILYSEVNSGSVSPTIGNKRKEEEDGEGGGGGVVWGTIKPESGGEKYLPCPVFSRISPVN